MAACVRCLAGLSAPTRAGVRYALLMPAAPSLMRGKRRDSVRPR